MQNFSSLSSLIEPKSVAIIGASNDPHRIGGRALKYMLERPFAGDIYPVNPMRDTVQGLRAYHDVSSLPGSPDVAILALAAELVPEALKALASKKVKNAVIFSSGFAEAGAKGELLQQQIIDAAGSMRILGPNSLGVFNEKSNFWGTFTATLETGWPLPGRIGIASQSGAYGAHMLSAARAQRLGISVFVATGNEADITVAEAIGWMAENNDIDVIISYIEGVRNGYELIDALRLAKAARKPVILLKAGRSALGSQAAMSHTAALAGDDAVIDAVLREFGVIRVNSAQEALDVAKAAALGIYPENNTMGVLTVSGGAGIIISDDAEQHGVSLPEVPADARARMQAMLPFSSTRNPVDCTAQALNEITLTGNFGIEMVQSDRYSSMLIFFSQAGGVASIAPGLRAELRRIRKARPDILYILSVLASDDLVHQYEEDGFLVFDDPGRAVRAIAALGRLGQAFAAREPSMPPGLPNFALPAQTPNEAISKLVLAEAGISVTQDHICTSAEQAQQAAAQIGYPVVMKILSPDILHKTEIGGVLLNVDTAAAVGSAYETLITRAWHAVPDARIDGVLVSQQVKKGVECIMGIQHDPIFGPMALFGLGGIHVEVFKDVVLRRCPFNVNEAHEVIKSIRGLPLLEGVRGSKAVDFNALAEMLSRLSVFAAQAGPRLRSVDLNPVIATPDGAWAVDAVLELENVQEKQESSADI
ncbi:acetate--CoA ligase family protein [Alcaligenaceae bacterium]|nr:acetate--CoA ligase family protein [Alcaligenaceae bacterium]